MKAPDFLPKPDAFVLAHVMMQSTLAVLLLAASVLAAARLERASMPRVIPASLGIRIAYNGTPAALCAGILFALTGRPLLACLGTASLVLGLGFVSRVKHRYVDEHLVAGDFFLIAQVVRNFVFYATYVGLWRVLLGFATAIGAVTVFFAAEPSIAPDEPILPALGVAAAALMALELRNESSILHRIYRVAPLPFDFERYNETVAASGLVFSLIRTAADTLRPPALPATEPKPTRRSSSPAPDLPTIVVVQSESFFDPRALPIRIVPSPLPNFDAACAEAISGALEVPAWGANTVRSEFSFLTGLPLRLLSGRAQSPYETLIPGPTWSIAHAVRELGYRTVAVHPFHKHFFRRDEVFPRLGFERFVGLEAFGEEDRVGRYVGDLALAERISAILEEDAGAPTFLFAVTMENHGFWHSEKNAGPPAFELHGPVPERDRAPFSIYLRHLRNADRMIGRLREILTAHGRPALLCFFGDHVPAFHDLFSALGFADRRTRYFIWRTDYRRAEQIDLDIGFLAGLCLEELGLATDPHFYRNAALRVRCGGRLADAAALRHAEAVLLPRDPDARDPVPGMHPVTGP